MRDHLDPDRERAARVQQPCGRQEDVTDIVLNVKQIALKMEGEGPKRLQLNATGPADVKAGGIEAKGAVTGYTRSKRD